MQSNDPTHDLLIQEQFTRQARPFAEVRAHSSDAAMAVLFDALAPAPCDTVLDVACGPGIVACALAPRVASVRGIDIVPAMLGEARDRQARLGIANVEWEIGDSSRLPYPDESFSLVTTRYSFHHLLDPLATLREMVRVCRGDGRIAVTDVAPAEDKREAYDRFETIRDPSHARGLTERELTALFDAAGLEIERVARYSLALELEATLRASFPEPGGADRLRTMLRDDIGRDALGVGAHLAGTELCYAVPIVVLTGRKRGIAGAMRGSGEV